MPIAVRDGVRLHYLDEGAGDPPILFVHGWCCDQRFFAPQVSHFARGHRVVAVDQRGFGRSDKPRQRYTIESLADDLAWLCGEIGLDRPLIVGHSLGGAVALASAARSPDLPAGIALCDPAIFFPQAVRQIQVGFASALESEGWQQAARQFVDEALFIDADDPALRQWIVAEMLRTPQHVMQSAFAELIRFDDEAAARDVRVPVLAITADTEYLENERFRALCPQLESAHTPGAGHFHQLFAPDAVNAILEPFVRRCASG